MFGQLPGWLTPLLARLAAEASALWPPALAARQPLFNQLIVNLYQPGQGITPHVDLARFQVRTPASATIDSLLLGEEGISPGSRASAALNPPPPDRRTG